MIPQRPDAASDADLLEVALGRADAATGARVAARAAVDGAFRERLAAARHHLARYDRLPAPPSPPPWARVAEALLQDARFRRRRVRLALAVPAAAALAAFLLLGPLLRSSSRAPGGSEGHATDGPVVAWDVLPTGAEAGEASGLVRSRAGAPLPAGAAGVGDRLAAASTTELRFGEDHAIGVLETGAVLDVLGPRRVGLASGRAWFEVTPDPQAGESFRVTTRWGDVEVRGTAFEVDARGDVLAVAVGKGLVEVAGQPVAAGERWVGGTREPQDGAPGGFARVPSLSLGVVGSPVRGKPVVLSFGFRNPRSVPLRVPGRDGAPTTLWLSLRGPDGTPYDLPVPPDDWLPDGEDGFTLLPGERRVVPVRFLHPFASPGPYRGTALYRPTGLPAVRSGTVEWEVR